MAATRASRSGAAAASAWAWATAAEMSICGAPPTARFAGAAATGAAGRGGGRIFPASIRSNGSSSSIASTPPSAQKASRLSARRASEGSAIGIA